MGNHTIGREIIERALALLLDHPDWAALHILDKALEGNQGTDADFESIDPQYPTFTHPLYLYEDFPPSPFAELLRRAFAPQLDPREMLFAVQPDNEDPRVQQRIEKALEIWEEHVLTPFRTRYNLG